MKQVAGIYSITNVTTMDAYVGQTLDIDSRRRQHFRTLEKGSHVNSRLQASYDAHGLSVFFWAVIELCPVNTPEYDGSENWHRVYRARERDRAKWLCDKEAHYIQEIPATFNLTGAPKFSQYGWIELTSDLSSWENVDEYDDAQPEKPVGLLFSIPEAMPNEIGVLVRDALLRLPNREREAVEVHWGIDRNGRSMADLSRQNGVSPQRMHQICSRGEERLKEILGSTCAG